jgi:hypothetical protein
MQLCSIPASPTESAVSDRPHTEWLFMQHARIHLRKPSSTSWSTLCGILMAWRSILTSQHRPEVGTGRGPAVLHAALHRCRLRTSHCSSHACFDARSSVATAHL